MDPGAQQSIPAGAADPGTSRLGRNLAISWAGQLVFMVAGFVLPRSVDGHLGQVGLGVWDFGWSIVHYFGLAQLGINSSVNPYVARHRAANDPGALNRVVCSVLAVQVGIAALVLVLAGLAAWAVPWLIKSELSTLIGEARWVVFLLGSAIALSIAMNPLGSVITGCHRWDLHALIESGSYAVTVVLMLTALQLGGGLREMALLYLCGMTAAEACRAWVAHRVCPDLALGPRHVRLSEARRMFAFGGKVFVGAVAGRLQYQTTSLLIAGILGPALLAQYSRPMALVLLVGTFLAKLSHMLTPIASQMQVRGGQAEIRGLLVKATQYSAALALPPLLFLAVMGGPLLHVWMGPDYAGAAPVLALLAFGHLVPFANRPMSNILIGVDAYGRAALASVLAAAGSVAMGFLLLERLGAGLLGAALAVSLPMTLAAVYVPSHGCRRLGLSLPRYLVDSWSRPLLAVLPFAVCLVALRLLLPPVLGVVLGVVVGGGVLGLVYWCWVLPAGLKSWVERRVPGWTRTEQLVSR